MALLSVTGVAIAMALLPTPCAHAHPEGFSGFRVIVFADHVHAELTLHTRDFSRWFPPGRHPDYVPDVCRELERQGFELIELWIDDQQLTAGSVSATSPEIGLIQIDLRFPFREPATDTFLLDLWSKHLIHMPRGHQQILSVEDRRRANQWAGAPPRVLDDLLSVEREAAEVEFRSAAAVASTATADTSESSEPTPTALAVVPSPSSLTPMAATTSSNRSAPHLLAWLAIMLLCLVIALVGSWFALRRQALVVPTPPDTPP